MDLSVWRGGARVLVTAAFELDMGVGPSADNDFELSLPMGAFRAEVGDIVLIEGTPYGGVVDSMGFDFSGKRPADVLGGRSMEGVLSKAVVMPDGEHFAVKGEANGCIAAALAHAGDGGGIVRASGADSGVDVDYRFDRFCDLYSGLVKMLGEVGMRLGIECSGGGCTLSAVPSATARIDPSAAGFGASVNARPVNHLVCAGEGEGGERAVVHLYADADGKVSREQSLFGLDEVAELYSFTSADEAELVKQGTERLEGYQRGSTSGFMSAVGSPPPGSRVRCDSAAAGVSAVSTVESVTVKVTSRGVSVESSLGDIEIRR